MRLPITNDTTAGLCFIEGQAISVPNLLQDRRFNNAAAKPASVHDQAASQTPATQNDTQLPDPGKSMSVLCLPIKATEGHVHVAKTDESFATLGVVEVISPEPLPHSACAMLRDYVSMLGRVIERGERGRRAALVKSAVEELAMCASRPVARDTVAQVVTDTS